MTFYFYNKTCYQKGVKSYDMNHKNKYIQFFWIKIVYCHKLIILGESIKEFKSPTLYLISMKQKKLLLGNILNCSRLAP